MKKSKRKQTNTSGDKREQKQCYKIQRCGRNNSKGEVYSDNDLALETKNISNKQLNTTSTGSRNRRTKPKVTMRNNKDHRAKKTQ